MVGSLGVGRYKGLFSLVTVSGLILIVYGLSMADFQVLWMPPVWSRSLLIAIMPVSIILMCAADMPNNIKRLVRHPLLLGIALWGAGHLLANGDLASTILFASFALFSVINIITVNKRGNKVTPAPVSRLWDVAVIVIGLGVYGLIFYFHGWLTGMPLR
jgi:uncharacterized membrane protein